jgi:hypothetical protein
MANITAATGTYAGKAALPYVTPAIMAADTIVNNWCNLYPNVVGTAVLRKWSGASLRARTCGFDGGAATLGEVILATTKLEIKLQLCNSDLIATWEADMMRDSRTAPADTNEAMLRYVIAQAAKDVEVGLWRGAYNSTTGATTGGSAVTYMNGFLAKIVAASPAVEQALTGATDSTNILTRLAALAAAIPGDIAGDPDTLLYMSPGMKALYYAALGSANGSLYLPNEQVSQYAGYRIVTPRGMPADTFLFSKAENLAFGTDLTGNDFATAAAVANLNDSTLEDATRAMIAITAGTQVIDHDSYAIARRTS